jgi:F0F1-type ATP synthase assembly protein I
MEYLGLGAEIAASLLVPIMAGYFLDEYFGTSPIILMTGVLGAMIGFGFMIIRITKKLDADD